LFAYIAAQNEDTLFLFIPYLFASTILGAQIWPDRSLIIPCLHDEGYANLSVLQQVMTQVRGLIFLAEAEESLANRLFPPAAKQFRTVIGAGVQTNWQGDGRRFREKYGLIDTPFMLYVGRRQAGKNTPLLTQYWLEYLQKSGRQAKLVLIGPGNMPLPAAATDAILDLGFVTTQDKYDAYAAADIFCMPSRHESFSFVIMESWLAGTPILVHRQCAVTKEHCQKANGGLYFKNYLEFAAMTDFLL
jgi:glycosyltransferase involved in cell wall biosynthesis